MKERLPTCSFILTARLKMNSEVRGETCDLGGVKGGFSIQSADGSATLKTTSGFSDSGKLMVENDTYCAQWGKVRKGKKGCWTVMHTGGGDYHLKSADGGNDNDVKIVK